MAPPREATVRVAVHRAEPASVAHTQAPAAVTTGEAQPHANWRQGSLVPMEVWQTPDRAGQHEQQLFLPAQSLALICLDPVQVRAQQ
ncbi:MAG: hypothetical protein O2782_19105 [bacterium]|nr:hypothetical protein [bacterium]